MNYSFLIRLEWLPTDFLSSEAFDLDLTVFLLNSEGEVAKEQDFIFYNNLVNENEAVTHSGDNIEGKDGKLAEEVKIQLAKLTENITRIAFAVSLNLHEENISFGQISNAYLKVINLDTEELVIDYDLSEDFAFDIAIIVGEFERGENGWLFKSLIQSANSLEDISKSYGLKIE